MAADLEEEAAAADLEASEEEVLEAAEPLVAGKSFNHKTHKTEQN